jgi:putative transposase
MRFAFIDAWKEAWSVEFLCRIMQVTSRGFRAWRDRPMSQRQRDDMVLLAHIREQHRLSLQSYGRPRMTEELQELGLNVGHGRVGRFPLIAAGSDCRAVDARERHQGRQDPKI